MNLIIDIGNSFSKLSLFRGEDIIHLSTIKSSDSKGIINEIKRILEDFYNVEKVILSSVSSENTEIIDFLSINFKFFINLNHKTKVPIKNLYKTPKTLGKDRLAAIIAANNIYRNTNVLVFDAGTALTVDFINKENEYLGGSISPGIEMRFKSLHNFTVKLPKLKYESDFNKIIGETTNEAIISGVQNGIINEVKGIINTYSKKYPKLKVFFTGGDTFFFEKQLKNQIFADPNLVLKGLNIILKYNAK